LGTVRLSGGIPYYLAILVNLLGPIRTVAAASRIGAPVRQLTTPNRVADSVDVEVATHASAVFTFTLGVFGTAHEDDSWRVIEPVVELFGAVGTKEQSRRGLGVRDLADAIEGGVHRANASFAFHVLEALCAVDESAEKSVQLDSTCLTRASSFSGSGASDGSSQPSALAIHWIGLRAMRMARSNTRSAGFAVPGGPLDGTSASPEAWQHVGELRHET
jgi:hypothetical protein